LVKPPSITLVIEESTMKSGCCSAIAFCLWALAPTVNCAEASMGLKAMARSIMTSNSQQRVELTAKSLYALETALHIQKNVSKAQEDKVVKTLESEVHNLEANVAELSSLDKKEKSSKGQLRELKSSMKPSDQAMMDKMNEWSNRMNRKSRLGAMDVISKLKNAIHLVKKGALSGNGEAAKSLDDVMAKMGAMSGQSTGKFLH